MRRDKVLLIAGGIGITPVRALAEELCEKEIDTVIVYGARTGRDIVFQDEFSTLGRHACMVVHHVVSDDPAWQGESGRIDASKLARLVPDCADRDAFVCGPPPMMVSVVRILRTLGIPRRAIHFELFAL